MSEVLGLDESLHGEHAYETLEVEGWLQGEPHGLIEQIDRSAKRKNWPAPRNSRGGAGRSSWLCLEVFTHGGDGHLTPVSCLQQNPVPAP
jgi:hypothetical protein